MLALFANKQKEILHGLCSMQDFFLLSCFVKSYPVPDGCLPGYRRSPRYLR